MASEKREEDLQPEPTELDDVLGKEGTSKARATAPGGDAADVQVKHKNSAKKKPPTGNTADNIRVNICLDTLNFLLDWKFCLLWYIMCWVECLGCSLCANMFILFNACLIT